MFEMKGDETSPRVVIAHLLRKVDTYRRRLGVSDDDYLTDLAAMSIAVSLSGGREPDMDRAVDAIADRIDRAIIRARDLISLVPIKSEGEIVPLGKSPRGIDLPGVPPLPDAEIGTAEHEIISMRAASDRIGKIRGE